MEIGAWSQSLSGALRTSIVRKLKLSRLSCVVWGLNVRLRSRSHNPCLRRQLFYRTVHDAPRKAISAEIMMSDKSIHPADTDIAIASSISPKGTSALNLGCSYGLLSRAVG